MSIKWLSSLMLLLVLPGCGSLKISPESQEIIGKCLQTKNDYLIIYAGSPSGDGAALRLIYGNRITNAYISKGFPDADKFPLLTISEFKANPTDWKESIRKKCNQFPEKQSREYCMKFIEDFKVSRKVLLPDYVPTPVRDIELLPKGTQILITGWEGYWVFENGDSDWFTYEFVNFKPKHDIEINLNSLFKERISNSEIDDRAHWKKDLLEVCKRKI